MKRRMTTESFVAKITQRYGCRYEYTKTEFTSAHSKVIITCRKHGDFTQTPNSHMNGRGCPNCGIEKIADERRKSLEDFVKDAEAVHGHKYNYSHVEYKNRHSKISIVCHIHGDFSVTPGSHLSGVGCAKCAAKKVGDYTRKCTSEFISQARNVHGDYYSYDKVDYVKNSLKVIISCKAHGDFEQSAAGHLVGKGCPECAHITRAESVRKDTAHFISRASAAHGDRYGYENVKYTAAKTLVSIKCAEHGEFFQSPDKHMMGRGCPSCANTGYDTTKAGTLYVLTSGDVTKVGITNRSADKRSIEVSRSSGDIFKVLEIFSFEDGLKAANLETKMHRWLADRYPRVDNKFDGSTECFVGVDLELLLDTIDSYIKECFDAH